MTPPIPDPRATALAEQIARTLCRVEGRLDEGSLIAEWTPVVSAALADAKREAQLEADQAIAALQAIWREPHGCCFCDSGVLRKPGVPGKDHEDTCGFRLAEVVLHGKATEAGTRGEVEVGEARCVEDNMFSETQRIVPCIVVVDGPDRDGEITLLAARETFLTASVARALALEILGRLGLQAGAEADK